MDRVDVAMIGAGQALDPLVTGLTDAGRTVAVIERRHVGGSCVNFGCTPSKAALASARLLHQARRSEAYGLDLTASGDPYPAVIAEAKAIAEGSRQRLEEWLQEKDGVELVYGHAQLVNRQGEGFQVQVGERTVLAQNVVLNTGTRSAKPKIEGLDEIPRLDAGNWLDLRELPRRLAIIGAGTIAVEMGQFYARMGSQVTLVDREEQPLSTEDPDVSDIIRRSLEEEGVRFEMQTSFDRVRCTESGYVLECSCPDGPKTLEADAIFVATGRQPNTDDLGIERLGVNQSEKGFINVDERLQTNVPGLYAGGDIRGGPMFTNTAWDDGRIILCSLLEKPSRTTDRVVPYAIFTDPQVAHVGLHEHESPHLKGLRFEMQSNGRAQNDRETRGFVKLLVNPDGTVAGVTIVAAEAAEMIHPYVIMMQARLPLDHLRDSLFIHPTYAEAVQSVAL